jgi:hypothetical protein
MLGWLRRKLPAMPNGMKGGAGSGTRGETLLEGVYAGPGSRKHYALDGQTRLLCGGSPARLHRWASAWYLVDAKERCARCDSLVGERGNEAHGARTIADMIVLGLEAPANIPPAERARYERERAIHMKLRAGEPPPPAPGSTFDDPPFVFAEDPAVTKQRVTKSTLSRVLNDVYGRNQNGKKWHRVYQVGHAHTDNEHMARYGRSFLFACGGAASEFEPGDDWVFSPTPLRTDVPGPDEACKSCRQSDAKYGKGEIPNTARWDR